MRSPARAIAPLALMLVLAAAVGHTGAPTPHNPVAAQALSTHPFPARAAANVDPPTTAPPVATTRPPRASRAAVRPRPSVAHVDSAGACKWRDKSYCWTDDPFAAVSACEAGMNPHRISANGKWFGAFQWDLASWHGLGETGRPVDPPHDTYEYQRAVAVRMQATRGWQPWPRCRRILGLP